MAGYNITITSGAQGTPGVGVPAGGTTGQFLQKIDGTDFNTQWTSSSATITDINEISNVTITNVQNGEVLKWNGSAWVNASESGSAAIWGNITGTLSSQTDLQAALDAKLADITGESIKDLSDVNSSMIPGDGEVLTYSSVNGWQSAVPANPSGTAQWGSITGTLSNQTDLQNALDAKAASVHTHVMADITDSTWISDITGESLTSLSDVPDSLVGQAGKLVKVNPTENGFIYGDPSGTTVSWGDIAGTLSNQTDLQNALDAKAASVHTHTTSDITDLASYTGLDVRYYTEAETDALLGGKSDTGHTHTLSDITDSGTMAAQDATSVAITGGTAVLSSVQLSGGTGSQGTVTWNTDEETLDVIQDGAVLQVGQEVQYHVRNNTGSTIANGTPVMATGTIGASGRITVAPMDGTNAANARYFLGVTTEDILTGEDGKVTHFGKVRGIQTDGINYGETWNDGDIIYVSDSAIGEFTNVEPTGLSLPIAFVIHAASNGTIMVRATDLDHNAYADAVHTHVMADITDSTWISTVTELDVTQHQAALSITESQISDFGTYIPTSQKGAANGVATLDAGSKVPTSQLPALALTEINTVANEAAMIALTAQEGDIAIRTDINKTFAHNGGVAGDATDWSELLTPTDAVLSVDGRTGAVTLSDLYEPKDATILKDADIGGTVQAYLPNNAFLVYSNGTFYDFNVATTFRVGGVDVLLSGDNVSALTNDAGYLTDVTGETLGSLSDVTITGNTSGEILVWNGSAWINNTLAEAGISAVGHTHTTSDITSGTFADARIAESNVTQHQAALSVTESQISDLGTYLTSTTFASMDTDVTDSLHFFNGMALDSPVVTVTSNGTVISLNLEKSGGGDIRFKFNTGVFTFDATPIASVTLTAGSDTSPQINYVYIPEATGLLTVSTSGFPAAEHAPIATVLCQSAASLQTDGAYKVHAWTDHADDSNHQGHLTHLNEWIRRQQATWESGVAVTPTAGAAQLDIATSAGNVLQLHDHAFPAFNTATGSELYVVNHPTTAYTKVGSLTQADGVDVDANGTALGGGLTDFYNLVIWGVVNEASGDCKLMLNLPDGAYANNNANAATLDTDATAVYTIPSEYTGVGFLIARLTIEENAGTYTVLQNEDLRGLTPSTAGGGAGGANGTEFADNVFRIQDEGDTSKEIAFQASGITTATTRTITMPDADVDLGLVGTATQPGDNVSTLTNDSNFVASGANVSVFTNDAGYLTSSTATLQTTDATTTVLATIAIPTDEEKIVRVRVHGHEDATDDHIWKTLTFGVKNVGGTASQVGGVDSAVGYDAGASTWNIVAGVSAGNATITVTGEASHAIDWRATVEVD